MCSLVSTGSHVYVAARGGDALGSGAVTVTPEVSPSIRRVDLIVSWLRSPRTWLPAGSNSCHGLIPVCLKNPWTVMHEALLSAPRYVVCLSNHPVNEASLGSCVRQIQAPVWAQLHCHRIPRPRANYLCQRGGWRGRPSQRNAHAPDLMMISTGFFSEGVEEGQGLSFLATRTKRSRSLSLSLSFIVSHSLPLDASGT